MNFNKITLLVFLSLLLTLVKCQNKTLGSCCCCSLKPHLYEGQNITLQQTFNYIISMLSLNLTSQVFFSALWKLPEQHFLLIWNAIKKGQPLYLYYENIPNPPMFDPEVGMSYCESIPDQARRLLIDNAPLTYNKIVFPFPYEGDIKPAIPSTMTADQKVNVKSLIETIQQSNFVGWLSDNFIEIYEMDYSDMSTEQNIVDEDDWRLALHHACQKAYSYYLDQEFLERYKCQNNLCFLKKMLSFKLPADELLAQQIVTHWLARFILSRYGTKNFSALKCVADSIIKPICDASLKC